jgi:hypothetical protein
MYLVGPLELQLWWEIFTVLANFSKVVLYLTKLFPKGKGFFLTFLPTSGEFKKNKINLVFLALF